MPTDIENAIDREEWNVARKLIRAALRVEPDSHWLLTRLALTYYEQRNYKLSLGYSEQALAIQPKCPLALWDHAGTLAMLGRKDEAIQIYRRLVRRGVDAIANGDCGEGLGQARGLIADCWYRIALCQKHSGATAQARISLKRHLDLRGPGCRSIYPIAKVRLELRSICA